MTKDLKKIIILSLIPAFLTVFFIVQFTVPSVTEYIKLEKQVQRTQDSISSTKTSIRKLAENKLLQKKLNELNAEVAGFDVEFPSKFGDEILLIDLEIFAQESLNNIFGITAQRVAKVNIIDPSKPVPKKKRGRAALQQTQDVSPITIMEKPFEMTTVAYYNEIIDFISFLESYQRKINIQGIYTKVFNDDRDKPNPRVELMIKGSIYKSVINKIKEQPKEEKTKHPRRKSKRAKK